jgi:flagellar hook assembly protein FlgD
MCTALPTASEDSRPLTRAFPVGEDFASVSVDVYDLTGTLVWSAELTDVTEIGWDGTDMSGASLANGTYLYVIYATDGTNSFSGKGAVFVNR